MKNTLIARLAVLIFLLVQGLVASTYAADGNAACWIKKPLVDDDDKPTKTEEQVFNPSVFEKLTSTDDAPGVLPESLRKHWTVMFRSQSIQRDDNRVIAFSKEDRTIVAFTGCPSDKDGKKVAYPQDAYPHCETIEVMHFKEPAETIEFTSYKLPGKNHPGSKAIVLKNPKACNSCHGGSPHHAIWEPYNIWPGACGSRGREGYDVMKVDSPEWKACRDFYEKVHNHPDEYKRYSGMYWKPKATDPEAKKLLEWALQNACEPDPKTKEMHCKYDPVTEEGHKNEKLELVQQSIDTGPNAELNKMLSEWRGRSIMHSFAQAPEFPKMKYAFLSIALGCETVAKMPITDFLPPELNKSAGSYIALKKEIEGEGGDKPYEVLKKQFEGGKPRDPKIEGKRDSELVEVAKETYNDNPISTQLGTQNRLVLASPTDRAMVQVPQIAYLWKASHNGTLDGWSSWSQRQTFNFNDGRSALGPILKAFKDYSAACEPEMDKEYGKFLIYASHNVTPGDWPETTLQKACVDLAKKANPTATPDRELASQPMPAHLAGPGTKSH